MYVVILKNKEGTIIKLTIIFLTEHIPNHVAQRTANYFKERREDDVILIDLDVYLDFRIIQGFLGIEHRLIRL